MLSTLVVFLKLWILPSFTFSIPQLSASLPFFASLFFCLMELWSVHCHILLLNCKAQHFVFPDWLLPEICPHENSLISGWTPFDTILLAVLVRFWSLIREANIKENPVKSGFLRTGGGGGSRGPPNPDFLHGYEKSRFLGEGGVKDRTYLRSRFNFG